MLRANIFQYDTFSDGSCVRKLFADDVKMYATIDVNDDCKGLFDKLKSVEKWCSEWQLRMVTFLFYWWHYFIFHDKFFSGVGKPKFGDFCHNTWIWLYRIINNRRLLTCPSQEMRGTHRIVEIFRISITFSRFQFLVLISRNFQGKFYSLRRNQLSFWNKEI